jgi:hypothetical protein
VASAGTVTVDFAVEVAKANAGINQVVNLLKGFEKQLTSLNQVAEKRLKNVEDRFLSMDKVVRRAVQAFSVAAITTFVKSAADAADQLGKTADKLGIGTRELRAYQLAAKDAGVAQEAANKLLLESQKRLGEAATGTGEAAKFIKLLGLNVTELQQLSPDQLFATYAEAINGLSNRSEQLAAASSLMGKNASEAFNLIRAGGDAVNEAAAFVDRFGLALSRVEIRQIEQANDAIDRLQAVSLAAGQRIAAGLAPAVEFFATEILNATGNTKDLQSATEAFSTFAITAYEILANGVRSLQAAFFGLSAAIAGALAGITDPKLLSSISLLHPAGIAARLLAQATSEVSASLRASADENLKKAEEALGKVKSFAEIQETIVKAMEDSRRRAEESVAASAAADAGRAAGGLTLGGLDFGLEAQQRFDVLNDAAAAAAERQNQIQREITSVTLSELDRRNQAAANSAAYQEAVNIRAENAILAARQNAASAGLQALQAFAGGSKKVAIALVLINKARSIAQAIQNTAVAATLALQSDPYTGIARAAAVKAWGAAQVALIAATGYGEIQAIDRGGGASLGSPSNPVFTQPQDNQQFGATSQNAINIIVANNVGFDQSIMDKIIAGIREATDNRDVIIFGPNSRQARDLVPT